MTSADVVIEGSSAPDYFGLALTEGDFDGDGLPDLAIGAADQRGYNSYSGIDEYGTIFIYPNAKLLGAASLDDGDAGMRITGYELKDSFGQALLASDLEK